MDSKLATRVILSPTDKNTYDILYTNNGKDYKTHKSGFKSLEEALEETTIIKGSLKLLNDVLKNTN
jgi:hypothetical protein